MLNKLRALVARSVLTIIALALTLYIIALVT